MYIVIIIYLHVVSSQCDLGVLTGQGERDEGLCLKGLKQTNKQQQQQTRNKFILIQCTVRNALIYMLHTYACTCTYVPTM